MFLKQLEIFGFKSFPDKTTFSFDNGVTGIVGPNGCGKSNVSDAIKWVIGEQKARSLRGQSMQEVIFNGSEMAKPLGLAEVSIVLDNSQKTLSLPYNEIKITRKLYRSGESEYLINKKQCRLKDITDLLMDTGLGVDSYSVIEQGRMDRVLSAKPEDRRSVFEEAAGITKYKARRKEALYKLDRTGDNLLRVNDILTEVARQMHLIERQARKAKRYKEHYDELKRLDIHFLCNQSKDLRNNLFDNQTSLKVLVKQDSDWNHLIQEMEKDVVCLRQGMDGVEVQLQANQESMSHADSKYQVLQNQLHFNHNKIQELIDSKTATLQSIQYNHVKLKDLNASRVLDADLLEQISKKIVSLKETIEEDYNQLAKINELLSKKTSILEGHKKQILELVSQNSRNKDLISHQEHILSTYEHKKSDLLEEKEHRESRYSELESLMGDKESEVSQLQIYLRDLEEEKDFLQNKQMDLEKSIDKDSEVLAKEGSELSACKSELSVLEAMRRNYEGYSQATKEILKKRDQGEGVYQNVMSDLASMIEVKEPRFEEALEAVLGQYIQSIVVPDSNDLGTMLEYLRINRIGRASFVSLDITRGSGHVSSVLESYAGYVTCAFDVVGYDAKYASLMEMILGNIHIFECFSDMVSAFCKTSLPQCKFVTLSGEVLEGTGTVIGGSSSGKEVPLIGREKKITDLKIELHTLERDFRHLNNQLQMSKKNLKEIRHSLQEKRNDIQKKLGQLSKSQQEYSRYEVELHHLDDQMKLVHGELGNITVQEKQILDTLQTLKENNVKLVEDVEERQVYLTSFEETVKEVEEKKKMAIGMITEHKVAHAADQEKKNSLRAKIVQLEQLLQEESERMQSNMDMLEQFDQRREEVLSTVEGMKKDLLKAKSAHQNFDSEIKDIQDQKRQSQEILRQKESAIQEQRQKLRHLQKELKEAELKSYQYMTEFDAIKMRMKDTYQVDWEDVEEFDVGEIDPELNCEERVSFLKDKIEKMGPINTEAIEEFDILKERYDFLTTQIQDLNESKESLLNVIGEVNRESRKRFKEAFEQINQNFKDLFKDLFSGGRAELILLNEEDLLESGIEIQASPPGKRMQSISLMSGGERAMTGIALLFAMFKVNPSPFCVLDEIDAPLDDVNVDRFIEIMSSFKERTQFIVITHNKKTMAKADVIYGITMQKPGISKSIAIKLVEFEKKRREELVTSLL